MKWNSYKAKALLAASMLVSTLAQASPDLGVAEQQATNWPAIIMFLVFVGFTLFITKWAAKQTTSASVYTKLADIKILTMTYFFRFLHPNMLLSIL